jgi:putative transposase
MARKRYTTEQIIGLLREAEVRLSQGQKIGTICQSIGVSEQSYYRWRREYGGLKLDQAKRLKDLDRENDRLKRAVSELTLDKLILKEALEGKYSALPGSGRALRTSALDFPSRSVARVLSSDSHVRRRGDI